MESNNCFTCSNVDQTDKLSSVKFKAEIGEYNFHGFIINNHTTCKCFLEETKAELGMGSL